MTFSQSPSIFCQCCPTSDIQCFQFSLITMCALQMVPSSIHHHHHHHHHHQHHYHHKHRMTLLTKIITLLVNVYQPPKQLYNIAEPGNRINAKILGTKFHVHMQKMLTTFTAIGIARGCTGCKCNPRAEKNGGGGKFTGKSCKCTPGQRMHPRGRERVQFLRKLGKSGRW